MKLYSYWRSSSAYRVRIALNLKGIDHVIEPVHLVRNGGEQHAPPYRALNPHGLVPLLIDGDMRLSQSLAIIDYLDNRCPDPRLIPSAPDERARVLSASYTIACDTQPLQNLRVLQYLVDPLGHPDQDKIAWARHWITAGLEAFEQQIAPHAGSCCFGDEPGLADCVLMPQMYNAERFDCDLGNCPTAVSVCASLRDLAAFAAAHPDRQIDASPA